MNYDCTNCALRLICKKDPKPKQCYDWKAPKDMGVDHAGQINFK